MQHLSRFVICILSISTLTLAFPYDHQSNPDSTQQDLVQRANVRPILRVPPQPAARLTEPSPAIMELRIHFHIDPRSRNDHQVIMERIIRELDAAGIHYVSVLDDPPHLGDSASGGSSTTSSGPGSSIGRSAAGSVSGLPAGGELSNPGRSEPHSNQGNLSPRAQIPDVQTVRPSGRLGFPHNSNQNSNPVMAMSFQVKVGSRTGRPVPVAGEHIRKILIEMGAVNPVVECISGAGRSGKSPLRPGSSQRRLFARGKKTRRPGRQKEASGADSRRMRASATSALPVATSINASPGSGNGAASSSGCTTFTVRMNRVGVDPVTGMPSEQFVEWLRRGLEMAGLNMSPAGPSGAGLSVAGSSGEDSFDVGSSGAMSSGASPSGRGSSSAGTSARGYWGRGSHGTGPSGRGSSGRGSSGRGSSGRGSPGAGTSSAGPSDAGPPGVSTSGRVSSGAELSGQGSSGARPSGAGPSGARTNSGHATPYSDAASSQSEEFESGVWDSDTSSASSWSVVSSGSIPTIGGTSSGGSDVAGLRGAGKSKPGSNPRKLSRRGKQSRRPSRIAAKASQQNPTSASASLPIQTPATSTHSDAEIASLFSADLNEREHMSVRYENIHIDPVTGQPDAASVEHIKKEWAKRGWDLENVRIGHDERSVYKNPEYLKTSHSNSGSSAGGPSGADSSSIGASTAGPSPRGSSTAGPSDTGGSGSAGTSKLARRGKQSRRPSRVAAKAARKNEPSTTASLPNQSSATPAVSAAATAPPSTGGLRDGEVVKLTFDGVDIDPETGQPSAAFKEYARKLAADHGSDIGYLRVGDRTVFKSVKDARLSDWNTGSSKAGPSGVGSSGAGPSGAGSSRVRLSKFSISGPGFFGAGSSGAGPSGAGTFGAGVFGAGNSGAGTSGAGTSETGTSGTGASRAGSSAADPANPDGSSGAGTSKASSPPRKLAPRGKKTRRPTRQDRPSRKELATATSATSAAPTAAAAAPRPLQMQLEINADPATGLPDPNAMAHIQSVLDEVGGSLRLVGHYDAAAELEYGTAPSGASSAGAGPSALEGGPSSASPARSSNSGSLRLAQPPGIRGASRPAGPRLTRPGRASRVATANAPPTPRTLERRAQGPPPQSPPPSPTT